MTNNKEKETSIEKNVNDSTFRYVTIPNNSKAFKGICEFCDKYIVTENLRKNGGTLNYSGLVYDSKFLIVCINERNLPIAFNSVIEWGEDYYIYQIAVKKEHKQKGIGTELLKNVIEIAKKENKNITAHVRDYNVASKALFNKLGFEIITDGTNILYLLPIKTKKL